MKLIEKRIIFNKKTQKLCGQPFFSKKEIIFFPIPDDMLDGLNENEVWQGELKNKWGTGKSDKNNVPMFYQYFVPIKLVNKEAVVNEQ